MQRGGYNVFKYEHESLPCSDFIEWVHVNMNCQVYGVQAIVLEIGNSAVYPIHSTECPLLIKCHSINVTLLCSFSDWGKMEGKSNKQFSYTI